MKKNIFMFILICFGIFCSAAKVAAEEQVVTDGMKVSMAYRLTVDGKIMENVPRAYARKFIFRDGKFPLGVEARIDGMKVGEKKKIVVEPEWGYGEYDPSNYIKLPRNYFDENFRIYKGMETQWIGKDGVTIKDGFFDIINDEYVILNFNHKLAGRILIYEVEIVNLEKIVE